MFSFTERAARKEMLKHIPNLRRYARVLYHNQDDADDLVQACLERALAKIKQWKTQTDMRAWLFTIMHNISINQKRRHYRENTMRKDDDLDQIPAQSSIMNNSLLVSDIERGLDLLPEDQREVLLLIGMEQLSYQQAADVLDVPLGTVMSRLNRARRRLRGFIFDGKTPALRQVK